MPSETARAHTTAASASGSGCRMENSHEDARATGLCTFSRSAGAVLSHNESVWTIGELVPASTELGMVGSASGWLHWGEVLGRVLIPAAPREEPLSQVAQAFISPVIVLWVSCDDFLPGWIADGACEHGSDFPEDGRQPTGQVRRVVGSPKQGGGLVAFIVRLATSEHRADDASECCPVPR